MSRGHAHLQGRLGDVGLPRVQEEVGRGRDFGDHRAVSIPDGHGKPGSEELRNLAPHGSGKGPRRLSEVAESAVGCSQILYQLPEASVSRGG